MSDPPPSSSPLPGSIAFVEVDVTPESDSFFFVDLTGDLGHAGLFVATWRDIPVGRAVTIGAHLSDGRLVVSGIVRWVRAAECEAGPGLGIALSPLSQEDEARIARFCAERPPYYYEVEAA
ncbi:MAG TPA: PilZ domain-containing protein [Polyangiaceae bacterium]|jgi:Tfp pilus assembly protein PilZ